MGLGIGQSWQWVSRVFDTAYWNNTGKPIQVAVSGQVGSDGRLTFHINGQPVGSFYNNSNGMISTGAFVVPNGSSYSLNKTLCGTCVIWSWYELR